MDSIRSPLLCKGIGCYLCNVFYSGLTVNSGTSWPWFPQWGQPQQAPSSRAGCSMDQMKLLLGLAFSSIILFRLLFPAPSLAPFQRPHCSVLWHRCGILATSGCCWIRPLSLRQTEQHTGFRQPWLLPFISFAPTVVIIRCKVRNPFGCIQSHLILEPTLD